MVRRAALLALAVAPLLVTAAPVATATTAAGVTDGVLGGYVVNATYFLSTLEGSRSTLPIAADDGYHDPGTTCGAAFSPAGDALAYLTYDLSADTTRVAVLHADGHRSFVGTGVSRSTHAAICRLEFGGDGSYVVAELQDNAANRDELWRFEGDAAPTKIAGGMSLDWWDLRAGSDVVALADQFRPGIQTVNARTLAVGTLPSPALPNGQTPFLGAWAPGGERLLVGWTQASKVSLGWWTPAAGSLSTVATVDDAWTVLVSPSGSRIGWLGDGADGTVVMPAGGGRRTVVDTGISPVDWQPCPGGSCPSFATRSGPPGPVRIRAAVAGHRGGASTATARWRAPLSNGGRPIRAYQVQARRLRTSGASVAAANVRVPAAARQHVVTLPKGRYVFRVRAVSAAGPGPWSAATTPVQAR